MSAAVPALPMTCSGAMYPAEPTVMPVLVRLVVSSAWAMPKSMTFGPPAVSRTLEGLRSRCTIPAAWIAASASASPVARPYSIPASSGPRVSMYSDSEGPSAYSVTRNGFGACVSASITRTVHTPWMRVSMVTSRPNLTGIPGCRPVRGAVPSPRPADHQANLGLRRDRRRPSRPRPAWRPGGSVRPATGPSAAAAREPTVPPSARLVVRQVNHPAEPSRAASSVRHGSFEWYVLPRGLLASGDDGPGQGHRDQIAGGRDQERDVQVQGLATGRT